MTARAALSRPGDALLDEVASEVSIDKAALGTLDRIAQGFVGYPFPTREPCELLRLEDPHGPPPRSRNV
jgi:hypothetical protein